MSVAGKLTKTRFSRATAAKLWDPFARTVAHARVPHLLRVDQPIAKGLRFGADVSTREKGDIECRAIGNTANAVHPSEKAQEALSIVLGGRVDDRAA